LATPHTNLGSLYPAERERLRAFRLAASDLYRTAGSHIGQGLTLGQGKRELIPEAVLRAAAPALRLTLLQAEQAYFPGVIAALRLLHDPVIEKVLNDFADAWQRAEHGDFGFQLSSSGPPVGGKEIFEAWLYGRVTHHGGQYKGTLQQLRKLGAFAEFALVASFQRHARIVLALDAVIAEVLGEPLVWDQYKPGDERFF
jgi:hypothetical protein